MERVQSACFHRRSFIIKPVHPRISIPSVLLRIPNGTYTERHIRIHHRFPKTVVLIHLLVNLRRPVFGFFAFHTNTCAHDALHIKSLCHRFDEDKSHFLLCGANQHRYFPRAAVPNRRDRKLRDKPAVNLDAKGPYAKPAPPGKFFFPRDKRAGRCFHQLLCAMKPGAFQKAARGIHAFFFILQKRRTSAHNDTF